MPVKVIKLYSVYNALLEVYKYSTSDHIGKEYVDTDSLFKSLLDNRWVSGDLQGSNQEGHSIYRNVLLTEEGVQALLMYYHHRTGHKLSALELE